MPDVPVPSQRPTIICLLGMHRSGTSVIARVLNLLGVYLGPPEHLLRPGSDNPRGYWENQRLYKVNKRILARLGGDWREPPYCPPGWQSAPGLEDLRQRASAVVAEEFADAPVWGWKDPRTCLTLPFWQNLLPPMRYVICVRHPQSVARSLERRNSNFFLERGVYLWAAYLKSALSSTEGETRIIVSYEEIMNDWREGVQALSAFLGEPWRSEEKDLQEAVRSFISEDLRHHTPTADWLEQGRPEAVEAFQLVQEVYDRLSERGGGRTDGLVQKLGVALEILAPEVRRLKGTKPKKPKWHTRRERTQQDLVALIPEGETFILLDQDQSELEIGGRRRSRFPERQERSGGLPPDDDAAIGEIERLRQSGAGFMAFAWPSFWWLGYYTGLNAYLRGKFRCLLENRRVVVFDLRSELQGDAGV